MKKYIPKPGVPMPTPKPGKDTDKAYVKKPVEPRPTPKPDKKKKPAAVKRREVSDEQLAPRRVKPSPNRRRFLDELNEMNKRKP